jgi:hypothetical protein
MPEIVSSCGIFIGCYPKGGFKIAGIPITLGRFLLVLSLFIIGLKSQFKVQRLYCFSRSYYLS